MYLKLYIFLSPSRTRFCCFDQAVLSEKSAIVKLLQLFMRHEELGLGAGLAEPADRSKRNSIGLKTLRAIKIRALHLCGEF
jgi:hypothetical protein